MTKSISAMQARKEFGTYLNRVSFGKERFIIKRQGTPMAALISLDELEDFLEINNPRISSEISNTEKEVSRGEFITLKDL